LIQTPDAIAAARCRFPSMGRPDSPVYFDNPGGTQVPQEVADAVGHCLLHANANVHGAFPNSARADAVVAEAHAAMADFLGAERPEEIAFGPNMTTLTFALSRALGRELREGDEILLTTLDHDANIAPWLLLAEDRGLTVRWADIRPDDCTLDLASFERGLTARTRLAAFTYASNAVGTVNDVRLLTRLAHDAGALVFIDAVQYAPHGPMDVRELGCDFLACSPYKFFGPHAGALYSRFDHSERLRAYKVRPADAAPPHKWETGTQSHEALAGTTAAVEYIASLAPGDHYASRRPRIVAALEAVRECEAGLSRRMLEGLRELPVRLYGIADPARVGERTPTFAITADGHTPRRLAEELGRRGFNLWDGNYYALALMERLGLEASGGALRIGLAHYNTPEEVDRFLGELGDVLRSGATAPAPASREAAEHTSQG
jgi:cysteine desulfurase family protein (TIGR01976 family)